MNGKGGRNSSSEGFQQENSSRFPIHKDSYVRMLSSETVSISEQFPSGKVPTGKASHWEGLPLSRCQSHGDRFKMERLFFLVRFPSICNGSH